MPNETANPREPPAPLSPAERLNSWKEIAAYLKHSERTVRRWENEGLPVRRHAHKNKPAIYAYKPEIDAWWNDGRARLEEVERLNARERRRWLPGLTPAELAANPRRRELIVAGAVALLVLAIAIFFYFRSTPKFTDKDSIVLADFANHTGDSMFDDALRQGLAVQLEQSPFLSLASEDRIQQTLRLMGKPPDSRLTPEIARDLCLRVGSTTFIVGSIANLGNDYVIGLHAVNCATGDSLAEEQMQATGRERVLDALSHGAAKLREKLGESPNTVQKFDTPLEQATTPSLEALQAYSLGRGTLEKASFSAAVPLFQRAISLDPNFAMAYASLGVEYANLGESSLAAENTRKAYELRERVSERERFYIESQYQVVVTGNLEKARQSYELWAQTYPRAPTPPSNLNVIYSELGQHDRALAESREALRLTQGISLGYADLVRCYIYLSRLAEARAAAEEAQAKNFDSPFLHFYLYQLAFLRNDAAGMAQQVVWAAGKPGWEDVLLASEADTATYSGRLAKARELTRRAVTSAERGEKKETAASDEAEAALREALFGNTVEAQQRVAAALVLSIGREVKYEAALALALARDTARAQALSDDLAKRFPEDTIVRFNYLPSIHARLVLGRNDPWKAVEALQAAAPYELGATATTNLSSLNLYPAYVRGEAYLAAHRGTQAAAEFQKILDHRGIVLNEPIGALAHLQLGRAYALQGDTVKARAAYQDFLALWKDADPDIPILKAAEAEYAKLQ